MKLERITLYHVAVPLRKPIRHASHERSVSDNLVVRAELADGTEGYGEGVPRSYVTGETIESTFDALAKFDAARIVGDVTDYPRLVERLEGLSRLSPPDDARGMAANSARCALELALLDAYGRHLAEPVSEALRIAGGDSGGLLNSKPQGVRYSGAITADSARKERISAIKMRVYGFRQVKVKVGVEGQDDPGRLALFRRILGRRMNIRLDANEAWHASGLVERVRPLLRFNPSALEQPVPHEEVGELGHLRKELVVPIMLDESLCGYPDAVRAVDQGLADILNVRLSKCGGMLASLRIVRLARQHALGLQLGCHPGETGILSAAGRHFASLVRGLQFVEGSYDRHVLGRNVTREDITFGYGGKARPLKGPGLGVTVDPEILESLSVRRHEVSYG